MDTTNTSKAECLRKEAEALIEAARLTKACAILGDWKAYDEQVAAAREWNRLARLHPKTRAAEVRKWAK